jgi:hypothetical protein
MSFHVPNQYRVRKGRLASDNSIGNAGAFFIPTRPGESPLRVIASDGEGWEHVSVSLPTRCPTWGEMCDVKDLFWDRDDCVVQYHPPESAYVNNHPFCLHLWRPTDQVIPVPAPILVGILGATPLNQEQQS